MYSTYQLCVSQIETFTVLDGNFMRLINDVLHETIIDRILRVSSPPTSLLPYIGIKRLPAFPLPNLKVGGMLKGMPDVIKYNTNIQVKM